MANIQVNETATAFRLLQTWWRGAFGLKGAGAISSKYRQWVIVLLLVIGFILRIINLGEFRPIEADEVTWLMAGTSIIQTGKPSTWTIFTDAYVQGGIIPSDGKVSPYLDHPPLFSLLVGGWAWLVGETDMKNVDWAIVRVPMVALAMATIGLLYLFVKQVFGPRLALFTLAAMVFYPSHIVTSRFVAAEHWTGFLLIAGLYNYDTFCRSGNLKKQRIAWFLMWVISVAAILSKLSGVMVAATLIFISLYQRRSRLGLMLIFAVMVAVMLYAGWGYYYNWDVFLNVIEAHQSRGQSFTNFWSIMTWFDIGHFSLYDPSMIVGTFGLISLGLKYRKKDQGVYLVGVLLVVSLLFLYFSPVETYGWYKYLLYPLVGLGLGHVFRQLYKGEQIYLFLVLPLLAMVLQVNNIIPDNMALRYLLLLMYGSVVLTLLWGRKFVEFSTLIMILLGLLWFYEAVWVFNLLRTGGVV